MNPRRLATSLFAGLLILTLFAGLAVAKPHKPPKPPRPPASFYGMVSQAWLSDADVASMDTAGVDQLRSMVHWGTIEPLPGVYSWGSTDAAIAQASAHNIRTFPMFFGSPLWANVADGTAIGAAPASDSTRAAFARAAAAFVDRYGAGGDFWAAHPELPQLPVRAIQLWNEQNSPKYWGSPPDAASYAALLRFSATSIRATGTPMQIVLGGMWGPPKAKNVLVPIKSYLTALYKAGAAADFDAIAMHPYSSNIKGMSAQLFEARRIATKAGDRRVKMWITEFGWSASGPKGPYVKGLAGQARMLKTAYKKLAAQRKVLKLQGTFWYAWQDVDSATSACDWCVGSGLVDINRQPKPAYNAFSKLTP